MGVMDKMKFWKKGDDDLGDLGDFSDLGDFGLEKSSPEREVVSPTPESLQLGDDLGINPSPAPPSPNMASMAPPPAATQQAPQPQYTEKPRYSSGYEVSDIEKDMQIVLARLDAIRSSLDNINRRLDNLERVAEGGRQRYQW